MQIAKQHHRWPSYTVAFVRVITLLLVLVTSIPAQAEKRLTDNNLVNSVKVMLADTEDVWHRIFASAGKRYREPKLVLFSGFVQTRCGQGMAAMGPFYCPLDQNIYVDLAGSLSMDRYSKHHEHCCAQNIHQ